MGKESGFSFDLNINMDDVLKEIDQQKGGFTKFLKWGEGDNIIRLLPPVHGMRIPWVQISEHTFTMPGTGRLESIVCPNTNGDSCPICKKVKDLYDSKEPDNVALGGKLKKTKKYFYNIFLIESPHADFKTKVNEVFVMKCGVKINDIIQRDLKDGDIGLDLFNPIDGFNFIVNMAKNKGGMANYDLSKTSRKKTSIVETQKELDEILEKCVDLREFAKVPSSNEVRDFLKRCFAEVDEDSMEDSSKDASTEKMFENKNMMVIPEMPSRTEEPKVEKKAEKKVEVPKKVEIEEDDEDVISSKVNSYLSDLEDDE